jgi:hypothetical protein
VYIEDGAEDGRRSGRVLNKRDDVDDACGRSVSKGFDRPGGVLVVGVETERRQNVFDGGEEGGIEGFKTGDLDSGPRREKPVVETFTTIDVEFNGESFDPGRRRWANRMPERSGHQHIQHLRQYAERSCARN